MTHDHNPGFLAQADQAAAGFKAGVAGLVELARKFLAEGDDEMHAAATVAQGIALTATRPQLASLVGFAVTRIIELEDIAAAACPCGPEAPEHQHLTGGYRPDHRGGMSDAEFEDWQHERGVVDDRTRDAADRGPEDRT